MSDKSSEATKMDTAASDSCTRSGTFALLLTVTLALLIPYWLQRRNEVALGDYIASRSNLTYQLETLDENSVWKEYKATNNDAELMSIAELMKVSVPGPKPTVEIIPRPKHSPATKPSIPRLGPDGRIHPSPPTGLTVTMSPAKLDAVIPIADSLVGLDDSDLLSRSRQVSNFFEFSIVRWARRRENLVYEHMPKCFAKAEWETRNVQKFDKFVPAIDKDALLNCLTLRDVRELAQLELPIFSNPIQSQGRIQREVDVNPSSLLPRDLYLASVLAQLLLFFVIVHFGAFAGEAVSSEGFPVQGTLFSAFSRSRGPLLVFLLALWSPLCASIAVAVASRKWSLVPYTVLIGCALLFAYLILQRKSFFTALKPRRIMLKSGTGPSEL